MAFRQYSETELQHNNFLHEWSPSCKYCLEEYPLSHAETLPDIVRSSTAVPLNVWLHGVLGNTSESIESWSHQVKDLKWCKDRIIQKGLMDFCRPDAQSGRRHAFARIARRILDLAHGTLSGIGNFYSIKDITVVAPPTPKYRPGVTEGFPDCGFTRSDTRGTRSRHPSVMPWADYFLTFGIPHEYHEKSLVPLLNNLRAEYKLRRLKGPEWETKTTQTQVYTASTKGKKRNRDDDDDDNGNDGVISSSQSSKSHHTEQHLVDLDDDWRLGFPDPARCALRTLNHAGGTRTFTLSVIIHAGRLSFWYYDPIGCVHGNETLSLIADFEKVAAILVGFAQCKPQQFGALPPHVKPPTGEPYLAYFPRYALEGHQITMYSPVRKRNLRATVGKHIFQHNDAFGRRTSIYTATTTQTLTKKPLVLKISYQDRSLKPEYEAAERARATGVTNLAEIHMWADLWHSSDGPRGIFFEGIQKKFVDKTLRAIMYTRYLPLRSLFEKSSGHIPTMVDQIMDCIHDLRYKAEILHRDISLGNIMFELRDGQPHFVLIDFDLAVSIEDCREVRPPSRPRADLKRVGTWTFMARELAKEHRLGLRCDPIPHRVRHDYESLFWVSLVAALSFKHIEDTEQRRRCRAKIQALDGTASCYHKDEFLKELGLDKTFELPPFSQHLKPWFIAWSKCLLEAELYLNHHDLQSSRWAKELKLGGRSVHEGKFHYDVETFDVETVNGLLTRDALKAVLAKGLLESEKEQREGGAKDSVLSIQNSIEPS